VVKMEKPTTSNPSKNKADSLRLGPVEIRSIALWILAAAASVFLLKYAKEMLIPIVLSMLIGYALDPLVTKLKQWHIPRAIGAALLLLLIVGTLGWFAYSLRGDVASAVERIPAAAKKLRRSFQETVQNGSGAIEKVQKAATELQKTAEEATRPPSLEPSSGDVVPVQIQEPPLKLVDLVWWGSMGAMAMTAGRSLRSSFWSTSS
jgi:predicted PurR-regulated permease PerM